MLPSDERRSELLNVSSTIAKRSCFSSVQATRMMLLIGQPPNGRRSTLLESNDSGKYSAILETKRSVRSKLPSLREGLANWAAGFGASEVEACIVWTRTVVDRPPAFEHRSRMGARAE